MLLIPNYFKINAYFVYSSHKTATQTLLSIFHKHNLNAIHCHTIQNLVSNNPLLNGKDFSILKPHVLRHIHHYKNKYNTKLKIITVVRNPIDRLISSFFQSHHDDEITFKSVHSTQTTVTTMNNENLYNLYCNKILNNSLLGKTESIDEMSQIFDEDIISKLESRVDYYYYENDYIQLFVLDFKKLLKENILYLNRILGENFNTYTSDNLSSTKIYNDKYIDIKTMVSNEIKTHIKTQYNSFYFNAFQTST